MRHCIHFFVSGMLMMQLSCQCVSSTRSGFAADSPGMAQVPAEEDYFQGYDEFSPDDQRVEAAGKALGLKAFYRILRPGPCGAVWAYYRRLDKGEKMAIYSVSQSRMVAQIDCSRSYYLHLVSDGGYWSESLDLFVGGSHAICWINDSTGQVCELSLKNIILSP